jgi:hypothetical protein
MYFPLTLEKGANNKNVLFNATSFMAIYYNSNRNPVHSSGCDFCKDEEIFSNSLKKCSLSLKCARFDDCRMKED